jgi:hypothetical protein
MQLSSLLQTEPLHASFAISQAKSNVEADPVVYIHGSLGRPAMSP